MVLGNDLPDYRMTYDFGLDQVIFFNKDVKATAASLARGG
jgi:hypothetical protein